jgi:phosphoribosylaminoimidazole (AIR) synthetase
MGIGMEIVVKSLSDAKMVQRYAAKYSIPAFVIGHTEESEDGKNSVKIGSSIYKRR